MSRTIETLERYFQSFINQEIMHPFFHGLADYLEFIVKNPETKQIYLKLIEARNNEYRKLLDLENQTIKELDKARKKLREIVQKNQLSSQTIERSFGFYDRLKNGMATSLATSPVAMDTTLSDIAFELYTNGRKDLVKEFIVEKSNSVGHHFSDKLEGYVIQNETRKQLEKTEIWGVLFLLRVILGVIYHNHEKGAWFFRLRTAVSQTQDAVEGVAFVNAQNHWKRLKETRNVSIDEFSQFIGGVVSYKSLARRLHNYFLTELENQKETTRPAKQKLEYENGILYFHEQEIEISKNKNTDPHCLLETIFKDRNKTWSYDEIHEDWGSENYDRRNDWNKYYQAGYKVNQKVAEKTTIKDFLKPTKTSVKINQKYLENSL